MLKCNIKMWSMHNVRRLVRSDVTRAGMMHGAVENGMLTARVLTRECDTNKSLLFSFVSRQHIDAPDGLTYCDTYTSHL